MKKIMIPLVIVAVGVMFLFLYKSNFQYLNYERKTMLGYNGEADSQQKISGSKYRKPWEVFDGRNNRVN